ncbi:hypothetical protein V8C35DRAFT_313988 [Trichoderma chlorosporum]
MAEQPVAVAVIVIVAMVVVVVVVVVVLVACLASGAHDEGQRADAAAEDGADVKHGAARRQGVGQRKMAIGRGRQRKGRRNRRRQAQGLASMCPLELAKCKRGRAGQLETETASPGPAHGQALGRHTGTASLVCFSRRALNSNLMEGLARGFVTEARAALRDHRPAGRRHERNPFVSCSCSRARIALHCVRRERCAKRVEEREK